MTWSSIESALRANDDELQYTAFFGALLLLGLCEVFWPRAQAENGRRRRWPANFGLTFVNVMVLGALPVGGLLVADIAQKQNWGLLNLTALGPAASLALGVLLRSLAGYGIHLAMHKLPLFWRVHRIHHTDRAFDVSTTVRFHPVEFLIATPITLAAILALGISPLAIIVYEIFDAAMAVWTHANLRLPRWLDRALATLLVTPDMHRIHHSAHQPETDSNYGATFSLWDRLFGTFRTKPPAEIATTSLGLDDCPDRQANSLLWLLAAPFRRAPAARPPQSAPNAS